MATSLKKKNENETKNFIELKKKKKRGYGGNGREVGKKKKHTQEINSEIADSGDTRGKKSRLNLCRSKSIDGKGKGLKCATPNIRTLWDASSRNFDTWL